MLNSVVLMGRLTREPEFSQTQSGVSLIRFTIAVDRDFSGSAEKKTDFIDCVAWRNSAEYIRSYFHKGTLSVVKGILQVNSWKDNEGKTQKKSEVLVENIYFAESKKNTQQETAPAEPTHDITELTKFKEVHVSGNEQQSFESINEDDGDLPF